MTLTPILAHAQSEPLVGRADVNFRYGQERSIIMTEMWAPFAQDEDSVFYGDLRLMGDDQDNREGNLGIGYRTVKEEMDAVLGAHIWIDRRITKRGSTFHQITTGVEYLGKEFDVLLNGYIPLSGKKKYIIPNANPQGAVLAGTGILIDTDGTLLEESQHGLDLEFGWQLPFAQDYTDSARIYAGGYYFNGPNTEDLAGWRTRLAVDINPDIQIGGRFQKDDERGSQGFLEATVRFPFGQKKSFRKEGLRARLDDSPERDIDIVTGDTVTDTGDRVAVINTTTGAAQEVLHVDNTAGGGGDGSSSNPFNSLAAAEAAASAHTIIYVGTGDGGNTNQDQGITLSKTGQQLIGAGTNFVYDAGRFTTANGAAPTSILIAPAGAAPVIGNVNAGADGVTISMDNITVAGVTVDNGGTGRDGIVVEADGAAASAQNVTIQNVTVQNARMGIYIHGTNGGNVSAMVQNSVTTANSQHGIAVYDDTNGTFTADLGGGSMGSAGNNVLAANTLEDLAVDYDGRALSAQNNWWGQATGPDEDDPTIGIDPQIYYGAPINDGLVGHWTFDTEWTTNATAYDRSGNGNDGTLNGGLSLADQVAGTHGEALDFDGNTFVSVPDSNSLDLSTGLTLLAWFDRDRNGTREIPIGKGNGSGPGTTPYWIEFRNNDAIRSLIGDGATNRDRSSSTINASGWNAIGSLWDGSAQRNILNGNYDGAPLNWAGTIYQDNLDFSIGKLGVLGSLKFDGQIDDTRIYNRSLTAAEISELYRMDTSSTITTSGFLTAAP